MTSYLDFKHGDTVARLINKPKHLLIELYDHGDPWTCQVQGLLLGFSGQFLRD